MRVFPNLPLLVGELAASLAKTETLNVQGCFTKGELVFFFRMFFFTLIVSLLTDGFFLQCFYLRSFADWFLDGQCNMNNPKVLTISL